MERVQIDIVTNSRIMRESLTFPSHRVLFPRCNCSNFSSLRQPSLPFNQRKISFNDKFM